ncbi:hypothetical protein HQ563_03325 [bacterium]|nr:hypothetical protein [bacterium]
MKQNEPDIIDRTIAFVESRSGRRISREEAQRVIENVSALFSLLLKLDAEAAAKDTESLSTSEELEEKLK